MRKRSLEAFKRQDRLPRKRDLEKLEKEAEFEMGKVRLELRGGGKSL
jgi:hypothetical protein